MQVTFEFICIIIVIRFKKVRNLLLYTCNYTTALFCTSCEDSSLVWDAGLAWTCLNVYWSFFWELQERLWWTLLQDTVKTISRCALLLYLPKISVLSINIKTATLNGIKSLTCQYLLNRQYAKCTTRWHHNTTHLKNSNVTAVGAVRGSAQQRSGHEVLFTSSAPQWRRRARSVKLHFHDGSGRTLE